MNESGLTGFRRLPKIGGLLSVCQTRFQSRVWGLIGKLVRIRTKDAMPALPPQR